MIVSIKGNLREAGPLLAVIETNGLGYEVHIPVTTSEKLPAPGNQVLLHTHAVYREDAQLLYGFASREDRDLFRMLIEKVSGIGPRLALTILSQLSAPFLKQAIANHDVALLSKCPGIGKKTAERLVIELKDKLGVVSTTTAGGSSKYSDNNLPNSGSLLQDAIAALITLGYKPPEADKAARKAINSIGESATVESVIKHALR